MFSIQITKEVNFLEIRSFYHSLIDMMADAQYKPGWEKEIYPADDYLLQAIRRGELYAAKWENNLAAAMIINHEYNEGYLGVDWGVDASADEVMIIHALGVLPTFAGRGLGKHMLQKAISIARERHQKAIRLDVLSGNLPAEKLYTGAGFQHIKTVQMFYEDTGWTDFLLYEYLFNH